MAITKSKPIQPFFCFQKQCSPNHGVKQEKGRGKGFEVFSICPGDIGDYLEILKKGRAQKREVPADSRGTSRLHLFDPNATKVQGSLG